MKIEIIESKGELALVYGEHATMGTAMTVMDKGFSMVYDYLTELKKKPSGASFCAYRSSTADFSEFDIETGFPVTENITEKDGMYMIETYKGKAVTVTHKGAYRNLDETHSLAMKFIADNSLETKGVFYEYYLNDCDPSVTPEDELLTKIIIAIK